MSNSAEHIRSGPGLSAWTPTPLLRASIYLNGAAVLGAAADPGLWPWMLGAVAVNHLGLGVVGLSPQTNLLGDNMVRLPAASAGRREVALTFDDGPDPRVTPAVLDILDRHGAKATFFCVGRAAAAHPDLTREVLARGHDVENHSESHPNSFAFLFPAALTRQVRRAQATLLRVTGRRPRYFRAPMGFRNPFLDPVLVASGLRLVSWSRRGYDTAVGDPDAVLRSLTRRLTAGEVLLLHDARCARTRGGTPVVLEVLPRLLDHIAGSGLRPVSLSEAAERGA
jgi:peptidoglycan/xylan/chitin deacetylase (PgdA/CDA1 family)